MQRRPWQRHRHTRTHIGMNIYYDIYLASRIPFAGPHHLTFTAGTITRGYYRTMIVDSTTKLHHTPARKFQCSIMQLKWPKSFNWVYDCLKYPKPTLHQQRMNGKITGAFIGTEINLSEWRELAAPSSRLLQPNGKNAHLYGSWLSHRIGYQHSKQ